MRQISFSRRALAITSVLLLALSLLPLYAISFYNHPFYDDFGFSLLTRAAWRDTGSPVAVLGAALQNTTGIRNTWEGTYTTSFISAMQPGIFGEGQYWIATLVLLTALLLALWYFLRQALFRALQMDAPTFVVLFCGLAFCMVQFVPDPSEAFFWFNGGVAYSLLWSLMLFTMGLWLQLERCRGKAKSAVLFALALVLTAAVGGGKYSTVLFACLCAGLFTLWAFLCKRPKKWLYLALTLVLFACFAFSMAAPGNAVRAKTLQGGMSAPMAIAQALFFGLALMGHWFSLPLAAVALLVAALLLAPLRQSRYAFARPAWVSLGAACFFCAGLAPTLFTGNFLGDGRLMNTYFFTYVLLFTGLVLYWTGWALRKAKKPLLAGGSAGAPVSGRLLLIVVVMLAAGCVGYRPEGAQSYGPQNMTGGSAALSLLRGEAGQYHREMSARDAALNDPAQQAVALRPVTVIPGVFMSDALQSSSLEYVLSLYAEYYQKESVTVTPKGE